MPDNQNSSEWRCTGDEMRCHDGNGCECELNGKGKPAPAMLNGVEYDRELIAEMLDMYCAALTNGGLDGAGHYTPATIDEQAQLLRAADSHEARTVSRAADNRDAAGVVLSNDGTSEAQFIADGETLNCPRCGGSGHVGDTPTAAPAGEAVAWCSPDEVPEVKAGEHNYFWVAVRRKHNGRVYSFPAQYLNRMLLRNEWDNDTEKGGNRWSHGPTDEDEGSFPATGWHSEKEHGEYDGVFSPLLSEEDELVAWREVAGYHADTHPPAAEVREVDRG